MPMTKNISALLFLSFFTAPGVSLSQQHEINTQNHSENLSENQEDEIEPPKCTPDMTYCGYLVDSENVLGGDAAAEISEEVWSNSGETDAGLNMTVEFLDGS